MLLLDDIVLCRFNSTGLMQHLCATALVNIMVCNHNQLLCSEYALDPIVLHFHWPVKQGETE